MPYRQITSEERYMLAALRKQGLNQSQIAAALGRHRSSICRELARNCARWDGHYRPSKAQERTNGRRACSRRNRRFTARDFAEVDKLICQQWSPEQVAAHLRATNTLSISHETIYRHIWQDKQKGGSLYTHLRGARKQRRWTLTALTTAAGDWRVSVGSVSAPPKSRRANRSATGRSTPS